MNQILAYIGYSILLLNFILFFISFSNEGNAYKIFTLYLGLVFMVQILAEILIQLKTNNLFLSHFYFVEQFIVLSFFYKNLFKDAFQKKMVNIGLIMGLSILGIQYGLNPGLFFKFNLFEIFITSFLLVIYSAFHFYNLLNSKKEFYYINMGILLYLFGSTVLFLVGNLMTSLSPKLNKIPWILNSFLYIVYQVFIFVEWKKSNPKKIINAVL